MVFMVNNKYKHSINLLLIIKEPYNKKSTRVTKKPINNKTLNNNKFIIQKIEIKLIWDLHLSIINL